MAPSSQIDTERTQSYLSAMVRINSVNPSLVAGGMGESEIARWLTKSCETLGLELQLQETAPGHPNVIARWAGNGQGKACSLPGIPMLSAPRT